MDNAMFTELIQSVRDMGEHMRLDDSERQPVECWTRVMGYFRPISFFNIGKVAEHRERRFFTEAAMAGKGYPIPSGPKQPATPGKGKGKGRKGC